MRESQQLFFVLRLVRRIFEETLSRKPNQNSASQEEEMILYKPCAEEAGGCRLFYILRLRTFNSSICKNQKPIAVDVLYQAYPLMPLSG
jgi:hypothetical protein